MRGIDRVRVDQLIGVSVLIAFELAAWLGSPAQGRVPLALLGVLLSVAVAVRRRLPVASALVVPAAWTVGALIGGQSVHGGLVVVPVTLLFYGLGAFAAERRSVWALGVAVVVISISALIAGGHQASNLTETVILGLLVPYALGRMVRARATRERAYREQAEQLDAGRELRARTAAYDERTRIARELHDVIAHSVSVMVIQAGGARLVMPSDPERAEASLRRVERAAATLWQRCAGCSASSTVTGIHGRWRRSPGSRISRICCRVPGPPASRQSCASMASPQRSPRRSICVPTGSCRKR